MNEPTQLMSPADMQSLAESAAKSGMFGLQNPSQAICLMALCQAEGINPVLALRRYHIIEGKPSMRADAMLAEFQARGGGVVWHVRHAKEVSATLFADAKKIDAKALDRAKNRYTAMSIGDQKTAVELSEYGEETIIRTMDDAITTGTAMSWKDGKQYMKHVWKANPRQMLTARVITEGVRLIAPGVVAGIYAPEELEDSREAFLQDAGQAPDRDLAAMQAILAQHEENALAATTDAQRKHFQGLAADMRVMIQNNEAPPARLESTVRQVAPIKDELEKFPDDIPMQHATDLPKDLKMVKGSEVPQPKKDARQRAADAVAPTEEKKPETKQASEPSPAAWRDYVIQRIPSFKGRPLGSLTDAERNVLIKKRGTAALPALLASQQWTDEQKAGMTEDAKWIDLASGGGK